LRRARRPRHDALRARLGDPQPRLPRARRAHRALRGALGPVDVQRRVVPHARAVEVRRLPRGLLQAPAGRDDGRRVLRPAREGRAGDRRARAVCRPWPL
ncbi:MAG: hypothetical protein AVDCRST_MAG45-613, partial [uncultured Solirubrobacterales bacterium]